jgi:hypothetical protein
LPLATAAASGKHTTTRQSRHSGRTREGFAAWSGCRRRAEKELTPAIRSSRVCEQTDESSRFNFRPAIRKSRRGIVRRAFFSSREQAYD